MGALSFYSLFAHVSRHAGFEHPTRQVDRSAGQCAFVIQVQYAKYTSAAPAQISRLCDASVECEEYFAAPAQILRLCDASVECEEYFAAPAQISRLCDASVECEEYFAAPAQISRLCDANVECEEYFAAPAREYICFHVPASCCCLAQKYASAANVHHKPCYRFWWGPYRFARLSAKLCCNKPRFTKVIYSYFDRDSNEI